MNGSEANDFMQNLRVEMDMESPGDVQVMSAGSAHDLLTRYSDHIA